MTSDFPLLGGAPEPGQPPLPPPAGRPQPPLPRRGWAVRSAGWIIVPVGVVAYLGVLNAMLATQNPNLFPTLILIGALTVPLAVLLLAYGGGARPEGHAGLVAMTAVAGGIIGTTSAAVLEYSAMRSLPAAGLLTVGLIEEAVKVIVPLAIFLVARRHTPGMGVVLGIASGTGFAVLETMGYGFTTLLGSGGNVAAVDATLLLRGLLSPAGHVAWTGLIVWALWRTRDIPRPRAPWLTVTASYAVAVILHTAWDASTALWLHVVIAAASVAILAVLIGASHRRARVSAGNPTRGLPSH